MLISPCAVHTEKMQPDTCINKYFCKLCFDNTSYNNCKIIDEVVKEVLEVVLLNLNLEERRKYRICKVCCSKLFPAFNFKSACMGTEDLLTSYINTNKVSVIELKEIYLTVNENIQLTDIVENQRICRLCLQLVTYGFVAFNEVDNDIVDTYIPKVNISATKDPVICGPCFDSLCTHGGFVKNCLEAQEKYKVDDKQPYIKTDEIEIKLEDGHDEQGKCKNIDMQSYLKSEEIEIKAEDGVLDIDISSHNLNEETIENKQKIISEDIGDINKYETSSNVSSSKNRYKRKFEDGLKHQIIPKLKYSSKIYSCDVCTYETKYKTHLRSHQLTHKDPSEIHMYKCEFCTYETKYKNCLKNHQIVHKDPSETQMYKCDICSFETKFKNNLRMHQVLHKDSSEIQVHKCKFCSYESKYKNCLKNHQLIHKDPSEIQMYTCDACDYETKRKGELKRHQLTHKDPSEIQMYKCDSCTYETKYMNHLKDHHLTHKDPSEIQMYKCDFCTYETKYKNSLKSHQLIHKDPSEIQMYRCGLCDYKAKRKGDLRCHQLLHKNSSKI